MSNSLEEWEKKLVGKLYVAPGDEIPKGREVSFILIFKIFYSISNYLRYLQTLT